MTNKQAHVYLERLQREMTGNVLAYGENAVKVNGLAILALEKRIPVFVLCPKGWEGFRKTRYYCPSCKKMTRDHEKYCHTCGQAVKYPKLARSTTEHKLFLDWSEKT